ncbi:MAG: hypothetical protein Q7J31_09505 [Syntrophales bacterium]|nr:hypothetical protein [Syntrophales bacterium]
MRLARTRQSAHSVTEAITDKYTEDIAVDGSLIQKELGFMPQYDLKTGWEETIREMQGKIVCREHPNYHID